MTDLSGRSIAWGRITAEGAAIIVSILLAFAIQAWWEGQQEQEREISYLELLAADLTTTLASNDRVSALADGFDLAEAKLARAYFAENPPPQDSVVLWFSQVGRRFWAGPQLGTARSLVQGGNLDLIRDDSIRAGIPRYLGTMELYERFEELRLDEWYVAHEELGRYVDLESARLAMLTRHSRDSLAAAELRSPFPAGELRAVVIDDLDLLVMQPEVHRVLARMNRAKDALAGWRQAMREQSLTLLGLIEEELMERAGSNSPQ